MHHRTGPQGSVLIPCLLFLSLVSLTAVGLLAISSTEAKISSALDQAHQARLVACSAKEIALARLKTDAKYAGGVNLAFPGNGGTADVTVTASAPFERKIVCTGRYGPSRHEIEVTARVYPRHLYYALTVLDDLDHKDESEVLGDVYVGGVFKGETTATIVGDVDLEGSRTVLKDVNGDLVAVDGQTTPTVTGDTTSDLEPLPIVKSALGPLKTAAISNGQYYTSNQVFQNQDFVGVVYLAPGVDADFRNVTIRGTLVAEPPAGFNAVLTGAGDGTSDLTVKGGCYLKVVADPGAGTDLAIVAPSSTFKVEGGAWLDVLGCTVIGYGDFPSNCNGVVTGPIVVNGGVKNDGALLFQSPKSTRDAEFLALLFNDYVVTETEYKEP